LQGGSARQVLLDNLVLELVRTPEGQLSSPSEQRWQLASRELSYFRSDAIPLLIELLVGFADRRPRDPIAVDRLQTTLSQLDASEEIDRKLTHAGLSPQACLFLIQCVVKAGDPADIPRLKGWLERSNDWKIRSECVRGLAVHAESDSACRELLVAAMRDSDRFVRAQAAAGLQSCVEDDAVVEQFCVALSSSEREIRNMAVRVLARSRTRSSRLALINAYQLALSCNDRSWLGLLHEALQFNFAVEKTVGDLQGWAALLDEVDS